MPCRQASQLPPWTPCYRNEAVLAIEWLVARAILVNLLSETLRTNYRQLVMLYQCSCVFREVWLALHELGELGALTRSACIIPQQMKFITYMALRYCLTIPLRITKMRISHKLPSARVPRPLGLVSAGTIPSLQVCGQI